LSHAARVDRSLLLTVIARPLRATLFPYTTLFRSNRGGTKPEERAAFMHQIQDRLRGITGVQGVAASFPFPLAGEKETRRQHPARSEEHTSELQSRGQLVCRLLLEKKKNNK